MRVRRAVESDIPLLLSYCKEIEPTFTGYGHLIPWSWLFTWAGGEGFIQMIPYQIESFGPSLKITDCRLGILGQGYFHASAFFLSAPGPVRSLLRAFYSQYPWTFPHIMTVIPATLPGLDLIYRFGFHPSAYPKIWYRTHNSYADLPLQSRKGLRPSIPLSPLAQPLNSL